MKTLFPEAAPVNRTRSGRSRENFPKLDATEVGKLLLPYLEAPASVELCTRLVLYLDLLRHWNDRMNLTSVRDPALIVTRHFGESLFLARLLPAYDSLLDVGSGAGFPGLLLALARPAARVTLAESQGKKTAFLREAAWMLGTSAKVWPRRIEEMPQPGPGQGFDVVTARAVEEMSSAVATGVRQLGAGGTLAYFTDESESVRIPPQQWAEVNSYAVPQSAGRIVIARASATG